ncbi:MAG: acetyl-CoA carboxylase, carboxyltransferase subunit beta [Sedimentisphaerales bacterium]|nr:acetyl-CoA carboxylase, carboxyltransferase subunit beta [Sedimentisphaerales bacterium]
MTDNQGPAPNGPQPRKKRDIPDGLWMRCDRCEQMLYRNTVEKNLHVCPECGYHFRIGANKRIQYLADEGTFEQVWADLRSSDPLRFTSKGLSYKERLKAEQERSGQNEAMIIGKAFIKGRPVILAVMEPNFLMGSMGCVVGEKFCLAVEMALEQSLPLVAVCCSGGARMHEGVVSLAQMAKTAAALARFDQAGGLYISLLTDPTTGGVTASFAMLGDIILAEPGAMIGFAGPRTIAQTIKVDLPEGFQTAEFMLQHGFVDMIVHRKDQRSEIARLIDYCQR